MTVRCLLSVSIPWVDTNVNVNLVTLVMVAVALTLTSVPLELTDVHQMPIVTTCLVASVANVKLDSEETAMNVTIETNVETAMTNVTRRPTVSTALAVTTVWAPNTQTA